MAQAFNIPPSYDTAEMLRADLALAGIADKDGLQVVDFHSLRHTFITNLACSGVHPKVAMDLAGHSDINLTMKRYSHTVMEQRADAVAMLPELRLNRAVAVATGTNGPETVGDNAWRSACCFVAEKREPQRTAANQNTYENTPCRSGGMADAVDSKSTARKGMRVRLPPPVLYFIGKNGIVQKRQNRWPEICNSAMGTDFVCLIASQIYILRGFFSSRRLFVQPLPSATCSNHHPGVERQATLSRANPTP